MGTRDILNSRVQRRRCCTKLQERFDETDADASRRSDSMRSNRSVLSMAMSLDETKRILRAGAERMSKTLNELRTTVGTFAQRFRISTRRREILEEGPMTPMSATPQTISRTLLGRTPTKLYSPFGIDSPYNNPLSGCAQPLR